MRTGPPQALLTPAMRDVLRHLRALRLNDPDDQRIMQGLVAQLQKAVDDRAEQLELLPRG